MALSYTDIFADAGKYIKALNEIRDSATDAVGAKPALGDLLEEIRIQLTTTGVSNILEGTETLFDGFRDAFTGISSTLGDKTTERLTDRDTVVNELLGTPQDSDTAGILNELANQMLRDSESIDRSTITIGAPIPLTGNVGDGTVLTTKILDGITSPGSGATPQDYYRGLNSELAVPNEDMSLTCSADSGSDGLTPGTESFQIEGQPALVSGVYGWRSEGSGENVSISTLNAVSIIVNRDFETASGDVFSNWTITSGAASTEIIQETTPAEVFRGLSALSMVGTGTDATIRQAVSNGLINANGAYFLSVAVKGDATANGTLTIKFVSDSGGYTATAAETIELNSTALQAIGGGYAIQSLSLPWVVPSSLPSDLEIEISYAGGSAGTIRVDSLAFGPVTYANGVGFSVLAGPVDFVRGDRFSVNVLNSEKVFQEYFRREYKIQYPSSLAPTILDSLAT